MRKSHDADSSEPQGLSSLGVLDLDLSITPDVFGIRAFDGAKPLTCMLMGQSPNELRLLVPEMDIAPPVFHDILIEDLRLPRLGGCAVCHPVMSRLSAGAGRRGCFGPCESAGWNWTSFTETAAAVRS